MAILDTLKDLTIIVGGWWTFYLYNKQATAALNPQLGLSAEVHPYAANSMVVVARLLIKNVGKVPLTLSTNDRLIVTVRCVPSNLSPGYVAIRQLPVVFESENLLNGCLSEPPYQFRLEPGVEIDDAAAFVLDAGHTYHIVGTLRFTERGQSDWISAETMVTIPSSATPVKPQET
jgi:hypothetical protein